MNQNFIFTFILLATLLMVYAVLYQLWGLLPKHLISYSANADTFTLIVFLNPIISELFFTFTVSEKLNTEIPVGGTLFNATFYKHDSFFFDLLATFNEDFCVSQEISYPILTGTKFSIGIQKTTPDNLYESFMIEAVLID